MAELDVTGLGSEPGGVGDVMGFYDAIELAQAGPGGSPPAVTWLMRDGEQVAAIVPVGQGQHAEVELRYRQNMASPPGRLG